MNDLYLYAISPISFYRGSAAALLVYDISNYATFNNLGKWLEDIKKYADTNVVLMLVGNKSDLDHSRAVSVRDATAFAGNSTLNC